MILLRVLLVSLATTGYFAEEIVPVKTGNGPTPKPGGRQRKDPTADLPDLSRDELLAILDLIEKSGDTPTPDARTVPPRYPTSTSKPRYPVSPTHPKYDDPPVPTRGPPTSRPFRPTDAPFHRLTTPRYDFDIKTPPNYPAPIAPPLPASTTPKPKKGFFDKIFRGFLKIVAPQAAAGGMPTASAGNFLNSFLHQLQNAQQTNTQRTNSSPTSSAAVLNNLLKRLQGQNSEGSHFVKNLVQTLQTNNSPSTKTAEGAISQRANSSPAGSIAEQLFSSLLSGASQNGPQGRQDASGFAKLLQQAVSSQSSGQQQASQPGQKTATDFLFDRLKQVLQQTGGH